MTHRLTLPLVTAAALVVMTALAGCTTGGSPASSSSPVAASASASAAPSAHTAFTIPTTCLSAAEVSNLLGMPEYGPTVTASPGSLICEYLTATEDGAIIYYESRPGASPAVLAASVASNPPDGATVTPISHLGDAAYELTTPEGEGVIVLSGSTLITIAGGMTTLPRVESLAVDVLAG
ncbi:MAG: hypothetical protein ABJA11_09545 [Pseudolysinimonas sp.]